MLQLLQVGLNDAEHKDGASEASEEDVDCWMRGAGPAHTENVNDIFMITQNFRTHSTPTSLHFMCILEVMGWDPTNFLYTI